MRSIFLLSIFLLFGVLIPFTSKATTIRPFANLGKMAEATQSVVLARAIENYEYQEGDVIVGLASYGQATYETEYNGGMGSNGLTSARHDVLSHEYVDQFPDAFEIHL